MHKLVHAQDAGNGYHGNCKYCGLALVTDLGFCSWDDTKCDRTLPIKAEKERVAKANTNEVYKLAYEYFRFMKNWGSPFSKEGWDYIRGTSEPSFIEVRKAKNKYKFDLLSESVIKHILWNPYNKDDLIRLKKNKLVLG